MIVLGDQLNADSAAFDGFDREQDVVWLAEVAEESTHVWTHKARIVLFLSGMRHFRDSLKRRKYIQRMSNYCTGCPFDPALATGRDACPFTTLYWDFLVRHKKQLSAYNRMAMQLRNLVRKEPGELADIQQQAKMLREALNPKRRRRVRSTADVPTVEAIDGRLQDR